MRRAGSLRDVGNATVADSGRAFTVFGGADIGTTGGGIRTGCARVGAVAQTGGAETCSLLPEPNPTPGDDPPMPPLAEEDAGANDGALSDDDAPADDNDDAPPPACAFRGGIVQGDSTGIGERGAVVDAGADGDPRRAGTHGFGPRGC